MRSSPVRCRALPLMIVLAVLPLCAGACRTTIDTPMPNSITYADTWSPVLDQLHRAAAEADEDTYFSLFTDDAVFLGTDATERWTMPEFRAFAMPYFQKHSAWTYTLVEGSRRVVVSPDMHTATFDELLHNEKIGVCRGTGSLRNTPDGWKITQYNLSIPIPNDLAEPVAAQIRAHASSQAQ